MELRQRHAQCPDTNTAAYQTFNLKLWCMFETLGCISGTFYGRRCGRTFAFFLGSDTVFFEVGSQEGIKAGPRRSSLGTPLGGCERTINEHVFDMLLGFRGPWRVRFLSVSVVSVFASVRRLLAKCLSLSSHQVQTRQAMTYRSVLPVCSMYSSYVDDSFEFCH